MGSAPRRPSAAPACRLQGRVRGGRGLLCGLARVSGVRERRAGVAVPVPRWRAAVAAGWRGCGRRARGGRSAFVQEFSGGVQDDKRGRAAHLQRVDAGPDASGPQAESTDAAPPPRSASQAGERGGGCCAASRLSRTVNRSRSCCDRVNELCANGSASQGCSPARTRTGTSRTTGCNWALPAGGRLTRRKSACTSRR